ncbi:MAG: S-methyl-5-thioribose-1-phosphate isomerase [Candidatus Bipolaricaulia bacterium]
MRSSIIYRNGLVELIDQTRLPNEYKILELRDHRDAADAIRRMVIRGAPAIGVTAAYGVALGLATVERDADVDERFEEIIETLKNTRPTAINLNWALERMARVFERERGTNLKDLKTALLEEAHRIRQEDVLTNKALGMNGSQVIDYGDTVLTHCNTGTLATTAYGTALGVIRAAHKLGKQIKVLVDETRPFLQGTRLTAWELQQEGIPYWIITDSMASQFMKAGEVDVVITGADRIAANGDTANKIGTYGLAVAAHYHDIPFYIAAPTSTIDPSVADGTEIPIEERDPGEITRFQGIQIAPQGALAKNPAFDVTPAPLITGIITEKGILEPPFEESIARVKGKRFDHSQIKER